MYLEDYPTYIIIYIWVNFITTSLSSRSLESWLISGKSSPSMAASFRLVKYSNLPRYMFLHIYIYVYIWDNLKLGDLLTSVTNHLPTGMHPHLYPIFRPESPISKAQSEAQNGLVQFLTDFEVQFLSWLDTLKGQLGSWLGPKRTFNVPWGLCDVPGSFKFLCICTI